MRESTARLGGSRDVLVLALVPLAVAILAAPLGVPADHLAARTAIAYLAAGAVLRLVDVARAPATFRAADRVAMVLLLVDPRRTRRVAAGVRARLWIESLALGGVSVALLFAASRWHADEAPFASPRQYGRSVALVVALLAGAESTSRLLAAIAALFGRDVPALHVAPGRSRTLAEFWGRRWNRLVGEWLREHCYQPLARAGLPRLGVLAAFAASALIHVYPTAIAIGAAPAVAIGSFFVAHGALMLLESLLRVRRWPAALGRAYVVGAFALTAPLFSEPFLRSLAL